MRSIAVALYSVILALQGFGCFACGPTGRDLLSEGNSFNYQMGGADWPEEFHDCGGDQQSPINIDTKAIKESFKDLTARILDFGKGERVKVMNTGQSVHVSWETAQPAAVLLPVIDGKVSGAIDPLDPNHDNSFDIPRNFSVQRFSFANVELLQFHFHISSENAIDGLLYPMEAHLVAKVPKEEVEACGDDGCIVVFATLFEISEKDNDFLEPFFEAAPEKAGEEYEEELPEHFILNLNDLIPAKKTYYTWEGSFTTPPCTEGILWILFDTMSTVSARQLTLLQSKMAAVRRTCQEEAEKDGSVDLFKACNDVGDLKNNRVLQPINGRRVGHAINSIAITR